MKRTIIIFLALLFSLPPAAAQNEGGFEGSSTDFLPLEVGNQWTYKQRYLNLAYSGSWWERTRKFEYYLRCPAGTDTLLIPSSRARESSPLRSLIQK